jgi:hypothetical protein
VRTREHAQPVRSRVRRLLGRKVSVGAMLEFGLYLAVPYLVIGGVYTFLNFDVVMALEKQLLTQLPAGSDIAGLGITMLLWPMFLVVSVLC